MSNIDNRTEELRQEAIKSLKRRSEFWSHVAAYLLINGLIITIWFIVDGGGLFWPVFPLIGWGIGLFFHAMDVYRRPPSEDRIRREMERMT